jgi:subtilisin family serine protease
VARGGPASRSSRLAESDPDLLAGTGSQLVAVVVKLDYDSLATYRGGVAGIAPTSPSRTGRQLDPRSAAAVAYGRYIERREGEFIGRLSAIPGTRVGRRLRTVYGGVALRVPAGQVRALAALPGVVAVQRDDVNQLLTDSSPEFVGAPTPWDALGGPAKAGNGVIVGVLDSGSWPEHPSYADDDGVPAPPPRPDATARTCDFGDNPLTPAADVFACNDKLIAGEPFLETYNEVIGGEIYPDSARDSNGHGTHTSTTAAGGPVPAAEVFGVNRGAVRGVAPGAHIAAYKVCGAGGCFSSDSAAAVGEAVLDGVDVINFSVSGGAQPLSDPVELAFLDAYDAGLFVAASAGNSGPGAATLDHLGPWVTTVAASTQTRAFESILTLTSASGPPLALKGASITAGVPTPTPVLPAASAPGYSDKLCSKPAPPGTFAGKIAICERGVVGRAEKGFNVLQGGAVGMILYNPTTQDIETDNHWLPTVHLEGPEGAALQSYLGANTNVMASFTAGAKSTGNGDVMAAFSSRGPGGTSLKPDLTAPGVQILAGHTPTPEDVAGGPPGQLYQAIAGTSMSSPHVAGAGALLVDLHPDWTPGQVKSALMTTATTGVLKEDGVTPTDPFDRGAGRIDLTRAGDPGLTFSDTGDRLAALYADPILGAEMNLASINAPVMPGSVAVRRVATNTTGGPLTFRVSATAPGGARIGVSPASFTVAPGASVPITFTIDGSRLGSGQYFGQVTLTQVGGGRVLRLPVAFNRQPGSVTLDSTCAGQLAPGATTVCTVTAQNNSLASTSVTMKSTATSQLDVVGVEGAAETSPNTVQTATLSLAGKKPGTPSIAPGDSPFGFVSLEKLGIPADAVGDEDILNYDTGAPFLYAGETYSSIGISSNGYGVVGGGGSEDNDFVPQDLPNPVRPNNVLAPFWTDLTGDGADGIRAAVLTDDETGDEYFVAEWDLLVLNTEEPVTFQLWIGLGPAEDISYTYGLAEGETLPDPAEQGLTIGAENLDGSGGDQLEPADELAGVDLRVTSAGGAPGARASYRMTLRAVRRGNASVTTTLTSPAVPGSTIARSDILIF